MSPSPNRRLRLHEVLFLSAVALLAGFVARTEGPARPTAPVVSYAVAAGDGPAGPTHGYRVADGGLRCR